MSICSSCSLYTTNPPESTGKSYCAECYQSFTDPNRDVLKAIKDLSEKLDRHILNCENKQ